MSPSLVMSPLVIFLVIVFVSLSIATDEESDELILRKVATQRDVRSSGAILSFSIDEQLPVGTVVADLGEYHQNSSVTRSIRCQPSDGEQCLPASISSRYVILGQRPRQGTSFTLDSTSGIITTSGVIDRELVCSRREAVCVVTFDVAVQTADVFDVLRVAVTIDDTNDHAPVFPPPSIVLISIPESTGPDDPSSGFPLPVAIDADSLPNGVIEYQLEMSDNETDDNFRLVITGLNTSEPEVKLTFERPLDHESRDHYRLMLVAYDGGVPANSGSVTIIIEVEDVNDNSPMFEQSVYQVEVSESAAIGSVLLTPTASDADSGYNGKLKYRLSSRGQGRDDFRIDDVTGDVTLARRLDCARQSVYTVGLVAVDQGVSPLSGYSLLTVRVIDVNNHAPVIALSSSHVTLQAPPVGRDRIFVVHVSVSDDDNGDNAQVTCSVNDITSRDSSKEYLLESSKLFSDDAPTTKSSEYSTSLISNSTSIARPGLFTSSSSRSKYAFNLLSLFDKEFQITAERLSPETQLSYSNDDHFLLLVTCFDHGTPSAMTSTATVSVRFNSVQATVTASPGSSSGLGLPKIVFPTPDNDTVLVPPDVFHVGLIVARIVASSGGHESNESSKTIAYELVDGNGSTYFRVDRTSGHVTVMRPISEADSSLFERGGDLVLRLIVGASFVGDSPTALSLATLVVVVVDRHSNTSILPDATHHHGHHSYDDVGLLIRLTSRTSWPKYVAVFVGSFIVVLGVVLSIVSYVIFRRHSHDVRADRRFRNKVTSSYHVAFEFTTATDANGSLCTLNNGAVVLNSSVNSLSGSSNNSNSAGSCLNFGLRNSTGSLCCTSNPNSTSQHIDNLPVAPDDVTDSRAPSVLPDIVLFDTNTSSLEVPRRARTQNGCQDDDEVLRYCEQVDRSLRSGLNQQCVATGLPISRARRCILCDAGVCRSCDPPAVVTSHVQTWRPTNLELISTTTPEVIGSNPPMTSRVTYESNEINPDRDATHTVSGRKRVRFAPRTMGDSLSDVTAETVVPTDVSIEVAQLVLDSSMTLTVPDDGSLV